MIKLINNRNFFYLIAPLRAKHSILQYTQRAQISSISKDVYERNKDIIENHISVKCNTERIYLIAKNAINAFRYNGEAQHLSNLGCLSSYSTLQDVREKMMKDEVGRQILQEKPRINHESANIPYLLSLPKNTFGYHYGRFMSDRDYSSEERPKVTYMPDFELAYIYQRYKESLFYTPHFIIQTYLKSFIVDININPMRENTQKSEAQYFIIQKEKQNQNLIKQIHDFVHTLLGFDATVYDEIVVKWYEMIQLGFPSTGLSSFVGPLKFTQEEIIQFNKVDLPIIIQQANQSSFIMNVYFENLFEQNIYELRKKMNITLRPKLNYE